MWDLGSLTRDWTCVPCIARWIPNHWTTRQVPTLASLVRDPGYCSGAQTEPALGQGWSGLVNSPQIYFQPRNMRQKRVSRRESGKRKCSCFKETMDVTAHILPCDVGGVCFWCVGGLYNLATPTECHIIISFDPTALLPLFYPIGSRYLGKKKITCLKDVLTCFNKCKKLEIAEVPNRYNNRISGNMVEDFEVPFLAPVTGCSIYPSTPIPF